MPLQSTNDRLLGSGTAVVFSTDPEGRIIQYNKAAASLWGAQPTIGKEIWCGKSTVHLLDGSPVDFEALPQIRAAKSGQALEEVAMVRFADGTETAVRHLADPIVGEGGEVTAVVNILQPIQLTGNPLTHTSDLLYRDVFKSVNFGFCIIEMIFDQEGQPYDYLFIDVNSIFEQQTGLKDPVGKTARELVPSLEKFWFEFYGRVAQTREARHVVQESAVMNRWFDVFAFPFDDQNKNQIAILFSDISQQKLAEKSMHTSEERFRNIFENAGVSVWVEDFSVVSEEIEALRAKGVTDFRKHFINNPDSVFDLASLVKIVDLNQATLDLFKASSKEELVNNLSTIFSVNRESLFLEELIALAQHEGIVRSEFKALTLDGEEIWILSSINFDSPNRDYSQVVVTVTDITLHKQAEQLLRESEQRFKDMADAAPATLWLTNEDNECTFLSRGWYEYTSQVEGEGLGTGWLEVIHPDDQGRVYQAFLSASESQEPFRINYRIRHADNRYRWSIAAGRPRFSKSGEFLGFIGSVIDMHERIEAEEALRRLNDQLEQRVVKRTTELQLQNRRLRQLANQLAETEQRERRKLAQTLHDGLQQILVAGKIQLKLSLLDRPEVVEQMEALFDEAIEVSRSLAYSLSPPTLHKSTLPLALKWLSRWFESNHHFEVEVVVDDSFPVLSSQLKEFLFGAARELLLNSVKHSGQKKAKVKLLVPNQYEVGLEVMDKGLGFDVASIMQDDQELKGFGLFGMRERVTALGGKIEFESQEGEGACFRLTVPFKGTPAIVDKEVQRETAVFPHTPHLTKSKNDPIRILIADDHAIVRKGIISLLAREADLKVIGQAGDGAEAIQKTEALSPDVVIMDIDMPNVNGVEATRAIKQNFPETNVVGLSLLDGEDWIEKMYEVGMSAYLLKGGDADELIQTIRQLYWQK